MSFMKTLKYSKTRKGLGKGVTSPEDGKGPFICATVWTGAPLEDETYDSVTYHAFSGISFGGTKDFEI
jgi:hypothetical protein